MPATTYPQKYTTATATVTKPKDKNNSNIATFLLIWVVAMLLLFLVIAASLGTLLKGFAAGILDNRISREVYPGIFIGAKSSVEYGGRGLANDGIINVLNVTPVEDPEEIRNGTFLGVKGNTNANGYRYLQIPVADESLANIIRYFPVTNQFIGSALASGEPVLVHCYSGISASVTVVAAYLISIGMTPEYALTQIKNVRPNSHPNPGFRRQLDAYYHSLYPTAAFV